MNVCAMQTVRDLLGGDKFPKCESASLRLEKFVRVGDKTKKEEIEAVVKVVKDNPGQVPAIAPKGAKVLTVKLGGRLIVNQVGGVLENAGLCIHSHFNTPCIPGSAVKGCARHAAWQAWYEMEEGDEKNAAAKEVAEIFGFPTGDSRPKNFGKIQKDRIYLDEYLKEKCGYKKDDSHAGKVAFLSAAPENFAELVVDIVNCHHKDYYGGNKPRATDDESPVPNFFPVVKEGTAFTFVVVPIGTSNFTERALHWLKIGLSQNGIGAKTAAGYGWFDIDMTDYSSIKPDSDLIAQWELKYSSATKQKKEFFKSQDYLLCQDKPVGLMSIWEFIKTKDWWQKEKKNAGSSATREMLRVAQKLGREI